jgi:Domain of unknown function (DUF4082)
VGGATDLSGNALPAPVSWSFTTEALPACPCSLWDATAAPAMASASDAEPIELGVRFSSDLDGWVTGVRFYKGAGNTGAHTGSLWSSTGERLARATFTNETVTGWQTVVFDTPVPITAGTTYVASYHAPRGGYAADGGYFETTDRRRAPLRAPASAPGAPNGLYAYGPGAFPTSSFRATNYWVDVVFTTTLP